MKKYLAIPVFISLLLVYGCAGQPAPLDRRTVSLPLGSDSATVVGTSAPKEGVAAPTVEPAKPAETPPHDKTPNPTPTSPPTPSKSPTPTPTP